MAPQNAEVTSIDRIIECCLLALCQKVRENYLLVMLSIIISYFFSEDLM